ncbi:MAG: elongation factor P [Erysipelotrichaceae bacterium]|nr:elongation factor P [Erysipelotrichaceae bacterium]
MVISNELKPGNYFMYDGNLYVVLDTLHNKTAMAKMVIKLKTKNLRTGAITNLSLSGGEKVEDVRIDKQPMSYLYDDGDSVVFMNQETYEQISISKTRLEEELKFLVADLQVEIVSYEGEVLDINLPAKVALEITHTEPGVSGDTQTRALKDATCETGLLIKVPLFIEQGEKVWVKTEDGSYDSRAN